MKCTTLIVFISSLILCSCNQNAKNGEQIVTVGSIDSAEIARDTAIQKAIDESYEFATTLTISPTLVYDIRAFGGPAAKGGFAIIRRGTDNKADTVAQGIRYGTIINTFYADLNTDRQPEIYVATQSADSLKRADIIAYQFDKKGGATGIILPALSKEEAANGYRGHDSIYAENIFLVRQFPLYKKNDPICCPSGGSDRIYYRLEKNIFVKRKRDSLQ